jgi:hypothetical protein
MKTLPRVAGGHVLRELLHDEWDRLLTTAAVAQRVLDRYLTSHQRILGKTEAADHRGEE